jgi:hypothetical protein
VDLRIHSSIYLHGIMLSYAQAQFYLYLTLPHSVTSIWCKKCYSQTSNRNVTLILRVPKHKTLIYTDAFQSVQIGRGLQMVRKFARICGTSTYFTSVAEKSSTHGVSNEPFLALHDYIIWWLMSLARVR